MLRHTGTDGGEMTHLPLESHCLQQIRELTPPLPATALGKPDPDLHLDSTAELPGYLAVTVPLTLTSCSAQESGPYTQQGSHNKAGPMV